MTGLYIALAVVVDGCVGLAGALLPEQALARWQQSLVGFAAGVLISVAFVDLLPEALHSCEPGTVFHSALAGMVGLAALDWWLGHRQGSATGLPAMLLASDGIHNISDGAAIAAGFLVSPRLGLITAVAVIVHEIPKEVGDYALLRVLGMSRARGLLALTLVQLSAGLGALATVLAAAAWTTAASTVLGLTAGSFLFIGGAELLPRLLHPDGKRRDNQAILGFGLGVTVALVKSLF